MTRWFAAGLALAVVLGAASCSSGSDTKLAPPSSTVAPAETGAGVTAPASSAGEGTVVVAGVPYGFRVTACRTAPAANEPETARTLFSLDGRGTTAGGEPFTVEVLRFQTKRGPTTSITDTVDVVVQSEPPRQSEAQRVEVNGQITDLRDPSAATPLLDVSGPRVRARGTFGPADAAARTTVPGSLDATCPGGGS